MRIAFFVLFLFCSAVAQAATSAPTPGGESSGVARSSGGGGALAAPGAVESALTYEVYAGGIHALSARLDIVQNGPDYSVVLRSETYGLLKAMAPWSGQFSSKGVGSGGAVFLPEKHSSSSIWRGKNQQKEFTFKPAGHFVSYKVTDDGKDKTPKEDVSALAKDSKDILSATLDMLRTTASGHPCEGASKVFDGDRNFTLIFKETGRETFAKTDYNIYSGPAVSCEVEVIPGEGKWRKKPRGWLSIQEQGRKKGGLPTIWLAPLSQNKKQIWLPVKIRVKTDYGTLFMHLTSFTEK